MVHLLFCILSSTSILMIFRSLERFKIKLFHVIILNYITASFIGMFLYDKGLVGYYLEMSRQNWFFLSAVIGILLIIMFFMMGISAQKAGLAVTTVSTKMSVAIPMVYSIFHYLEPVNVMKLTGIVLAVTALALTAVKKKSSKIHMRYVYFPIILFIGMGSLDVILKYAQQEHITPGHSALFTGASFTWAFIAGFIACFLKKLPLKPFIRPRVLFAGILLGLCNFGSIFFMINALNSQIFESSIIFGMNSIGIVGLSVFLAITVFKEKLLWINWLGVGLAGLATIAWLFA